jgi:hypothetical protein
MAQNHLRERSWRDVVKLLKRAHSCLLEDFACEIFGKNEIVTDLGPSVGGGFFYAIESIAIFEEKLTARLPGSVHGVVVQMTTDVLSGRSGCISGIGLGISRPAGGPIGICDRKLHHTVSLV